MQVNKIGFYSNNVKKINKRQNNTIQKCTPSFKQNFKINKSGIACIIASVLSLTSCLNKQKNDISENNNTEQNIDFIDTLSSKQQDEKTYHYYPKEDGYTIISEYDWLEIKHPDGSIDIDSSDYKIHITPQEQRTEVKTETDKQENLIITTTFPDKSRTVKIYYKSNNDGINKCVEHKFRIDNTIAETRHYTEYPSDSAEEQKHIEEIKLFYDENEILKKWTKNISNPIKDTKNNIYDRKKRLIYDCEKNEKYQYKKNSKFPYRSTSLYDDCLRITLYNKNGTVKKVYFKAVDGTITED